MRTTRAGEVVSAQISKMGAVTGLDTDNFSIPTIPFNLKNDGDDVVELEVNLWDMEIGEFVKTVFDVGWNPEIIREIKTNADAADMNLKWGY